ncbi:MAG: hypothetical protein HY763_11190 [Planctomycetes bacterium]|nr:hypothetical protein [Planctomycetota bacterium]
MNQSTRRKSYVFLCAFPFLAGALMARPLRVPHLYQSIGAVHFTIACLAAWKLGARSIRAGTDEKKKLALAGTLFFAPFALVSLLWVGLGPPWVATPTENRMRYLVLLASAMAVSVAFVVLKEALNEIGERIYSALGVAANIFAGTAYMIWLTIHLAVFAAKVRDGHVPPEIIPLINMSDTLLFVACVLTYLTTAGFAVSMGRAGWLRRGVARAYVIASLVAFLLIAIRGLSFPDPTAGSTPWYTHPGFIAGIPAAPWIMPYLLGVVLLRRAGEDPS